MTADLAPLFAPRQVAVLGASRSPEKLGHRLLQNVLAGGFAGEVIPVNPTGEAILGIRAARGVGALPVGLDLALVSLPAGGVVEAARALGARRCRSCVVLASGFGEAGEAGRAMQAELAAIAGATGMRIVGPNCMGVVNVPGHLNGSYFWDVPREPGGISFISQSGAYGGLFFREARLRGLGVAKFLSIGNQSDLGFVECLDWLAGDPDTRVVALFVEGIRDGRSFVDAARRVTRLKPVVAFKGGRGEAGCRAVGSHTGSLAGSYDTYLAAFAAASIVVAEATEEFFDAVTTLDAQAVRLPRDGALAILTVSGGPSVVATDAAEALGLRVPVLPDTWRRRLRQHLPAFGADGNPVDLTPQMEPGGFGPAVRLVLDAPEVSGALAINVGLDRPEYADAVVAAQAATGKPVVACTADTPEMDRRLRAAGIPIFPTPERAVRAYRALVTRATARRRSEPGWSAPRSTGSAHARTGRLARLPHGHGALEYATSRALLERYGVAFAQEGLVDSVEDALSVAQKIGYPVVVKTARPGLLHRTEAGGVILNVTEPDALRAACRTLAERFDSAPVLVQERIEPGLELLIGGRRDPSFGPTVLLGLGGVFTELLRDVSLRLAPLGPDEAVSMLREGRKAELLRGFRGSPPCDERPLVAAITGVGDLLTAYPEIEELDLNPVIASGARAVAVDAVIVVNPLDTEEPSCEPT